MQYSLYNLATKAGKSIYCLYKQTFERVGKDFLMSTKFKTLVSVLYSLDMFQSTRWHICLPLIHVHGVYKDQHLMSEVLHNLCQCIGMNV